MTSSSFADINPDLRTAIESGHGDPLPTRLSRRVLSVGLVALAWIVALATLPLTFLVALTGDLLLRRRFSLSRALAVIVIYLTLEVCGVAAAIFVGLTARRETSISRHFLLQCWWARTMFQTCARVLDVKLEVEGLESVGRGPVIVLARHVSLVDTLFPSLLIAEQNGILLRYVLKRELLWDPCLDIVGHRLPNCFVKRGSDQKAIEIDKVRQLATNVGLGEGLMIFPEGTRFTAEKRAHIIASLERSDPALAARAKALRHTLPPRPGGTLAMLDGAPRADVLLMGHSGMEGARRLSDFWRGAMIGRTIRVRIWRIARPSVPTDPDGQRRWLMDQWDVVDQWLENALFDGSHSRPSG